MNPLASSSASMTPLDPTGGALAAAGAVSSGALGLWESDRLMDFNRKEAKKNRDFQERMSSTAHQREVADLERAGLNPILSAGGAGSSMAGGATAYAPSSAPSTQAALAGMGAMSQVALNLSQARLANSSASLNDLDREGKRLDNVFSDATMDARFEALLKNMDLTDNQMNYLRSQVRQQNQLVNESKQRMRVNSADAVIGEQDAKLMKKFGDWGPWIRTLKNIIPNFSKHK